MTEDHRRFYVRFTPINDKPWDSPAMKEEKAMELATGKRNWYMDTGTYVHINHHNLIRTTVDLDYGATQQELKRLEDGAVSTGEQETDSTGA